MAAHCKSGADGCTLSECELTVWESCTMVVHWTLFAPAAHICVNVTPLCMRPS